MQTAALIAILASAASADIISTSGEIIGKSEFRQGAKGVVLDVTVRGLAPGKHGLHFHAIGSCDASGKFASAQAHMGHDRHPHGFLNPKGPHAGDLPSIIVGADGIGAGQFYTELVQISGKAAKGKMLLLDKDGSSLVIHENEDDQFTQPTGNSGARIACGIIKAQ
jgi:superoxide dismutase, Cu-Zn family